MRVAILDLTDQQFVLNINSAQLNSDKQLWHQDFLTQCFQKDPEKRPGAETLLTHPWLLINRQTLRASWSRTKDRKSRGGRTQAHVSVASVVERMLEVRQQQVAIRFFFSCWCVLLSWADCQQHVWISC